MISCILLTAGESLRFGSPKALAALGSVKAIELVQQKLIQSLANEIIVVTGAYETLIKSYVLNHSKVRLVHNKDYKLGQTSSFQTGVSIVDKNSHGFMLLPIDCPFALTQTIDELILCFHRQTPSILIPTYRGRRGHPPIFHQKLKQSILDLPKDQGLNCLITQFPVQSLELNDPGITQSFNTKEDLEKILLKARDLR